MDDVARPQLDELTLLLRGERGGGFVVLGERGFGKTIFLKQISDTVGDTMLVVDCPAGGYEALEAALAAELGLDPAVDLDTELPEAMVRAGIKTVGIDNAQRLTRPWLGGQKGLDRVATLDGKLGGEVAWVLMIDRRAWRYILLSRGERALFQQIIELPPWSEEQLAELIRVRSAAAGIDPDYRSLVMPRQLDPGEHPSIAERNRHGYARILWELADGNPEVALHFFIASLHKTSGGQVSLRLPQPRFSAALTQANVETLLTLRVTLQCDIAAVEDISRSLRISEHRARATVRFCEQNQWIEHVDGGFRVRWESFRMVTQALFRQNLMPR